MQCHECGNPREADSQFCPWCFALPAPAATTTSLAAPTATPTPPPAPAALPSAAPTYSAPPTRSIPFTSATTEPGYLTEPSSTPNPFERRLSFGRDGGTSVLTAPAPVTTPGRTTDLFGGHGPQRRLSSTLIAAGASALVLILLGVAVVTMRSGGQSADEAIADATLAMATDDDVRAALNDVATAEAAYFKANGVYTSSAKDLRKAAARAPMAKGFDALRTGVVYVDASAPKGAEPAFYLAAKAPSGGCAYLKGVPDGLSESRSDTCVSGFAADYGKSPQQKRADAMMLQLADLGAGWETVEAVEDEEMSAVMDPEFDACLGRPTISATAAAKSDGFTREGRSSSSAVIPFTFVWPDDIVAQRDLALVDHPKLGPCLAESIRAELYGPFVPYVFDRITLTVSDRGTLPGAPESRRVRLRPTATLTNGTQTSFWMDLVFASRGRLEAVVLVMSFGVAPDDALTARLVTAMLGRG